MTIRIPKALLLAILVVIAAAAGVAGAYIVADPNPDPETIVTTETETRTETVTTTTVAAITGLGADVIEDLLDRGAIDEAVPVTPEEGWETEYEISPGQTRIRFREDPRRTVGYESRNDRVFDAIDEVTDEHGYTERVGEAN